MRAAVREMREVQFYYSACASLLQELVLEKYGKLFAQHKISIDFLPLLNEANLIELGFGDADVRESILLAVKKTKAELPAVLRFTNEPSLYQIDQTEAILRRGNDKTTQRSCFYRSGFNGGTTPRFTDDPRSIEELHNFINNKEVACQRKLNAYLKSTAIIGGRATAGFGSRTSGQVDKMSRLHYVTSPNTMSTSVSPPSGGIMMPSSPSSKLSGFSPHQISSPSATTPSSTPTKHASAKKKARRARKRKLSNTVPKAASGDSATVSAPGGLQCKEEQDRSDEQPHQQPAEKASNSSAKFNEAQVEQFIQLTESLAMCPSPSRVNTPDSKNQGVADNTASVAVADNSKKTLANQNSTNTAQAQKKNTGPTHTANSTVQNSNSTNKNSQSSNSKQQSVTQKKQQQQQQQQ
eukprot:TRINITY_DN6197_c0_g1_i2.p1 TRINITY_DN6197_c0_g1~~TRINITY_DN6197_c0_g1_i2.p1  ORF type:complete len:409 (+),score=100.46 TRINITY_DN6197_c0_g1_i2:1187-2413(+)